MDLLHSFLPFFSCGWYGEFGDVGFKHTLLAQKFSNRGGLVRSQLKIVPTNCVYDGCEGTT